MSELIYKTHIGDEIAVSVYFDYREAEPRQRYPDSESEATINAVYVDGDENKDIRDVLDPAITTDLAISCCDWVEE